MIHRLLLLLRNVSSFSKLLSMTMMLWKQILTLALHITGGSLDDTDLIRLLRIILHLLIGMRILLGLVIETIMSLLGDLFLRLISSKSSKVSSSICHCMAHVAHRDLFRLAVQIV